MPETIQLEHRLTKLEAKSRQVDDRLELHDRNFEKVDGKLEDIVTMLSTRPTWLIAGLITILTTVTSGLIVYVATRW